MGTKEDGDRRGPGSSSEPPDFGIGGNTNVSPRPTSVPTMRDIAADAGVSQSTVSRVLNDAPTRVPIAAETRERVVLAARRLGYRPNPLARGLRGAPTMLLGAVVRDFSDPFFAGAIETLAVEAMARGYNVVLGHAHGRLEEAIALTTVLETRHTDAIVLLGDMQDQPRLLEDLRNSIVPVVALWQGSSRLEFPTVDVDDRAGIMTGLEYVVGLGHERIAFVSARLPGDNPVRQDAYIDFMKERFGGVPPGHLREVPNTLAGGEAALRSLLGLGEPPTAVVASTDLVAVGVLHAAYSLGRTIPDELSVVGFDDILIAAHTVPALTTMRMPMPEIVGAGVKLAIELARDTSASREPRITVFKPTLVVRQSTAPPPAR
jgi:DNA-binding LacI/PurR family transcriptional regulator